MNKKEQGNIKFQKWNKCYTCKSWNDSCGVLGFSSSCLFKGKVKIHNDRITCLNREG